MSNQRYPVHVRLIGVMQNKNKKIFMTSVLWSDQNDIIVYRKYEEFRKLHKQLQKKFPVGRGFGKKAEEVLPKFEDVPLKTLRKKAPSKSMLRLKLLEKYFTALIELEPKISQCNDVIQFFIPQNHDLEPSFPKNSIVIMPSEDQGDAEDMSEDKQQQSAGNITQPFIAETHRCVASYETKDTKNRPFKVNVEETVDVLIKDPAGWWLVENEEKHIAWFPAPYLEKCCDPEEYDDTTDGIPEEGMLYYAARGYEAKNIDELSVNIGVVVEVLQKSDNGWWLIRYNGKAGYVPSMYLQPYKNPHQKFQIQSINLYRPASPPGNLCAVKNLQLSRSHTSLQPYPVVKGKFRPLDRQKSRSLCCIPPPAITINDQDASSSAKTESRIDSLSDGSEESLNFSSCSSSSRNSPVSPESDFLSVSQADMAEQLQRSRTPPAMITHRRGSDCLSVAEQLPNSNSDPNLFKSSSMPKVPPRPKAQEILSRCTTITKRAAMPLFLGSKPTVAQLY
ncbi:NADPH oxidase organizer 1-like [Acipenser ruthenus]|uniref:NADPH oxidase organizer 1-like n=1 Tax=Acipenser ruthenus TaxID=7906 RepID=UPI001560F1CE|nr:NADPH oxidase organizer 1-like [Acipenser ruthenus]